MKMKIVELVYKGERKFDRKDAKLLRGYIANRFVEIIDFHNHIDKISFNYNSPKIQYRVIDGNLSIIGINEGGDLILKNLENIRIEDIRLDGCDNKILEKEISIKFPNMRVVDEMKEYIFDSFWIPLKVEETQEYKRGEVHFDTKLTNNILELFKLCDVFADKRIVAKGLLKEHRIMEKKVERIVFTGRFKANVVLPDYLALGRRKSVGYGIIKKYNSKDKKNEDNID